MCCSLRRTPTRPPPAAGAKPLLSSRQPAQRTRASNMAAGPGASTVTGMASGAPDCTTLRSSASTTLIAHTTAWGAYTWLWLASLGCVLQSLARTFGTSRSCAMCSSCASQRCWQTPTHTGVHGRDMQPALQQQRTRTPYAARGESAHTLQKHITHVRSTQHPQPHTYVSCTLPFHHTPHASHPTRPAKPTMQWLLH